MNRAGLLVVAVAFLGAGGCGKGDDRKNIQGTWVPVSVEQAGKAVTDEKLKTGRLVITADKFITKVGDKSESEETYTLEPGQSPKSIDISMTITMKQFEKVGGAIGGATGASEAPVPPPVFADKKETMKGIYLLDGDSLTLCLPLSSSDSRPTELKSLAGEAPPSGFGRRKGATMLLTLKREKR